jgi:transglutaminase-like putative cysteine protease
LQRAYHGRGRHNRIPGFRALTLLVLMATEPVRRAGRGDAGRAFPVGYRVSELRELAPYIERFSAWFEVFLAGRWYTKDARHNHPRIGRIVMGRGRDDAADVAMSTAFGVAKLMRFEVVTQEQVQ